MTPPARLARPGTRRLTIASAAVGVVALTLFVYTLYTAGLPDILDSVRRVGVTGFLAILALSGLRLVVRTFAWTICLEPPARLAFGPAFRAMLMGDALGNLTPLAAVVSEPSKAAFVGRQVPLVPAFSALVVENLYYALSLGLVVALGAVALLTMFRGGEHLAIAIIGSLALAGMVGLVAYGMLLANARPLTALVGWMNRLGLVPARLARHVSGIERLESTVNAFTRSRRARLLPLIALEAVFQVAGLAETWLTLALMGALAGTGGTGFLEALVLESTGRVVNLLFKFVPLRVGVDEAGAVLVANVLQLGAAAGGALALVRKARLLVWTGAGVALLLQRGLSVRRALDEARAAAAQTQR